MEHTKTSPIDTEQLKTMSTLAAGKEPSDNSKLLLEIISDLTELKKVDSEDYQNCLDLLRNGVKQNNQTTNLHSN